MQRCRKSPSTPTRRKNRRAGGFTLFEILLAVLFLAIAAVPMLSAFGPALTATADEEAAAVFTNQARGTLNRVLTLDYTKLSSNLGDPVNLTTLFGSAAEAAKEDFTLRGTAYTPVVAITDKSGGVGGLLEVTVRVRHVQVKTEMAQI